MRASPSGAVGSSLGSMIIGVSTANSHTRRGKNKLTHNTQRQISRRCCCCCFCPTRRSAMFWTCEQCSRFHQHIHELTRVFAKTSGAPTRNNAVWSMKWSILQFFPGFFANGILITSLQFSSWLMKFMQISTIKLIFKKNEKICTFVFALKNSNLQWTIKNWR